MTRPRYATAMIRQIFSALCLATVCACASGGGAAPAGGPSSAPAAAPAAAAPSSFAEDPAPGTAATCTVSGEAFTVAADSERVVHEGRTYVFCCAGCKDEFLADPAKFAAK